MIHDLIPDVTRTPERTPDVVRCEWLLVIRGTSLGWEAVAQSSAFRCEERHVLLIAVLVYGLLGGLAGRFIGRRWGKPNLGSCVGALVTAACFVVGRSGPLWWLSVVPLNLVFLCMWAWIGSSIGEVHGVANRGLIAGVAVGFTVQTAAFVAAWSTDASGPLSGIAFLAPLALGLLVLFGRIGGRIGRPKGKEAFGFWMGFVFGVIGWIVAAVVQPTPEARAEQILAVNQALDAATNGDMRPCPFCAEPIRQAAVMCRFCGKDLPAAS